MDTFQTIVAISLITIAIVQVLRLLLGFRGVRP